MSSVAVRSGLLLMVVVLNGCALLKPQTSEPFAPNQPAWQERQSQYSSISQWAVQARMATALLGWSGGLQWQQSAESLQLAVSGPLGIGGFQAQGTLQHVEVVTSDQQRLRGDPEVLYREVVGWEFPLRNMRYWALGLMVPNQPAQPVIDAMGRLIELRQAGWQVRYTEYRHFGEHELPRRMLLDNGELTIRIVIDDWQGLG